MLSKKIKNCTFTVEADESLFHLCEGNTTERKTAVGTGYVGWALQFTLRFLFPDRGTDTLLAIFEFIKQKSESNTNLD